VQGTVQDRVEGRVHRGLLWVEQGGLRNMGLVVGTVGGKGVDMEGDRVVGMGSTALGWLRPGC
jgi:hypothetical protein